VSSRSLTDFEDRLKQVQQLVDAHVALVRLKKAEALIESGGGGLLHVKSVIDALVSNPGQGRPPEVQALNSAAIALLSAHLQGYIADVFAEAAHELLGSHVPNVAVLIDAAPIRGNPNAQNIAKLFASLGINDALGGISWQRMDSARLHKKLREFNELRNRIVHGKAEIVHKKTVGLYMKHWRNLAERLDRKLAKSIAAVTGKVPW
jgi:hypothetical protein